MKKILFLLLLVPFVGMIQPNKKDKMNVLFIVVDDLRPQLGSYGNTSILTPNLDAFAKTAVQFNNAHAQVAVCGPSRSSFFSGLRPNTLGMVKLGEEGHPPAYTTVIPQVFKDAGYETVGSGKLFHGLHDLEKKAWTLPYFKSETNEYQNEKVIKDIEKKTALAEEKGLKGENFRKFTKGPATDAGEVEDEAYSDGQNAAFTIQQIKDLKDKNFFIAMGVQKPHLPFNAPKKYWDLYNREELTFPAYRKKPQGAPGYALANVTNGELHAYSDIESNMAIPDEKGKELIHGYNACVSYIDAQIGKVLQTLKDEGLADNTIVVIFADHGWKLGEYNAWSKHTNYEIDTRVPLLIRVPGMKGGVQTDALAELVDVFPTLCDLTAIEAPKELEGKSLVPVIKDVKSSVKEGAYSQFRRGPREGVSVRTENFRLVQWINSKTGIVESSEFYDHRIDPNETKSVFANEKYKNDIKKLEGLINDYLEKSS